MLRRIYIIDTILWKEVRYVSLYLELHNARKREELQGLCRALGINSIV